MIFSLTTTLEEIKLRGHVMMMSADVEFLLLKIIVACLADEPHVTARTFKSLPLEQKIAMLRHDLKMYQRTLYDEYNETIKKLEKIKTFRNKFAHCKISWDKKQSDLSFFYILIISEVKGSEKPQLIKMTYSEFYTKTEQIRQVILTLAELYKKMEDNFLEKYPTFYDKSPF